MAVCMLLSTPVHSMVRCGWAPSRSATLLASSWGPSPLFTASWKSAPSFLAIAKRSEDRSDDGGGLETMGTIRIQRVPCDAGRLVLSYPWWQLVRLPLLWPRADTPTRWALWAHPGDSTHLLWAEASWAGRTTWPNQEIVTKVRFQYDTISWIDSKYKFVSKHFTCVQLPVCCEVTSLLKVMLHMKLFLETAPVFG